MVECNDIMVARRVAMVTGSDDIRARNHKAIRRHKAMARNDTIMSRSDDMLTGNNDSFWEMNGPIFAPFSQHKLHKLEIPFPMKGYSFVPTTMLSVSLNTLSNIIAQFCCGVPGLMIVFFYIFTIMV